MKGLFILPKKRICAVSDSTSLKNQIIFRSLFWRPLTKKTLEITWNLCYLWWIWTLNSLPNKMPGDTDGIWGYKLRAYSPDPDGSEIGGICTHLDKWKSYENWLQGSSPYALARISPNSTWDLSPPNLRFQLSKGTRLCLPLRQRIRSHQRSKPAKMQVAFLTYAPWN